MVRPRVFVSSTYYDLKHIRNYVENFLRDMGFDAVLFERGDIPYSADTPLDESCYKEITNCHMLILIIGGHYGSPTNDEKGKNEVNPYSYYNSVTKKEFEKAFELGIPIFILIDKAVSTEYRTYKKNRDNSDIQYAHVDSINIFKLLDEILSRPISVFVQPFEDFDNIADYLREQLAGLFADLLSNRRKERELIKLEEGISELKEITESLSQYTESLMKKIQPDDYVKIIELEERRKNQSRIIRFSKEPMIGFIINEAVDKPTKISIYQAMKNATNLDDFINNIEIDKDLKERLLDEFRESAERDFDALKSKYFAI